MRDTLRVGDASAPTAAVGPDWCPRRPGDRRPSLQAQRGQAAVELLGGLPVLLCLGLAGLQLLAVGYASVLAGTAAEAGALALAGGADPKAGARDSLPGWSRARARVEVSDGAVLVRIRPPSPLAAVARRLVVTGRAVAETG